MTADPIHRTVAVLATAVLTAALAVTALATEVEAAKPKPKCQGQVATIVGTKKADILKGTARRDIIVAKGGNDRIYGKGGNDLICAGPGDDVVYGGRNADRIWGQSGHDKLYGNAGNDFLAGQVGNDTINGGIDLDTCYQGTGAGPVTNCELPAPPAPPAPPPPPPPATLVVAYTDVNANHDYDTGDIMIAEIVDTNGDGIVSPGDTINMGLYPRAPWVVAPARLRQTMEPWGVRSHPVTSSDLLPANPDRTFVRSGADFGFAWDQISDTETSDAFREVNSGPATASMIVDNKNAGVDFDSVFYERSSPSQPMEFWFANADSTGDEHFIDVEIFAP